MVYIFYLHTMYLILYDMKIYIVLSRDRSDFIYCTADKTKAIKAKEDQIYNEECSGGRPSVFIKTTTLQ